MRAVSLVESAEGMGVRLWPQQREILDAIDDGPRIHVLCLGRRSGKTFMSALLMLHNCLFRSDLQAMVRRGERRYAVGIATNVRQARLLVSAARSIVDGIPPLREYVEGMTEDEIRFTNGTVLTAFPCSSRGGRGWAISCLVLDEAAFFLSETDGPATADEIWRALSPSTAQFGEAGRIVVASTPNGPTGFFYDLHSRADAGVLPEARAYLATTAEMNPTITADFLALEEARDPEHFRGEFLAEWVEGGGQFFDVRELEFESGPAQPADGARWVGALDPAFHGDRFGVVLVGESAADAEVLLVGTVAGIEPSGRARSLGRRRAREDATLAEVWELLAPYAERGSLRVVTDQHQSDAIASYFGREGVGVTVRHLTGPLQTANFTATRARLTDGSLRMWKHGALLEELRRVRAGKNTESIVLPRHAGSHCDIVSALCLGVAEFRHGAGGQIIAPPQVRIPRTIDSPGRASADQAGSLTPKGHFMPRAHPAIPRGTPAFQRRIAARQLSRPKDRDK